MALNLPTSPSQIGVHTPLVSARCNMASTSGLSLSRYRNLTYSQSTSTMSAARRNSSAPMVSPKAVDQGGRLHSHLAARR
jgi:hypothetical protein